jgi:hypothetical protein
MEVELPRNNDPAKHLCRRRRGSMISRIPVSLGLFALFFFTATHFVTKGSELFINLSVLINFIKCDVSFLPVLAFPRDSTSFTVHCQSVVYHCRSWLVRRHGVWVRVVIMRLCAGPVCAAQQLGRARASRRAHVRAPRRRPRDTRARRQAAPSAQVFIFTLALWILHRGSNTYLYAYFCKNIPHG